MKRARILQRSASLAAAALIGAVVVGPAMPTSVGAGAPTCSYCGGGEYQPIAPVRVFDSRPEIVGSSDPRPVNDVAPLGAKAVTTAGVSFDIQLLDLESDVTFENPWLPDYVDPSQVLGVVVGITVVSPTVSGFLSAAPTGPPTDSSLLNFQAGQNVANVGVVRTGTDGKLRITLTGLADGSAHVLVDVFGWFATSDYLGQDLTQNSGDERGGRVVSVSPGRILDTRSASGLPGAGHPLGAGETREVQIAGATVPGNAGAIPADVTGVLLNLTAARPAASTFLSVTPETPVGVPATSNLNLPGGLTRAAMVIVPVGPDGKVRIYNANGTTNVLVDVMGYIRPLHDDTRAGRVIPLSTPFRAFDTRQPAFGAVPLGPGQAEDWSFAAFANSVTIDTVPVGAQAALIGNLTNARLNRQYPTVSVDPGFLTVYPTPPTNTAPPTISNLNSRESVTGDTRSVSNMALVKFGSNYMVRVFNSRGYAHYLFDVSAVVLAD